MEYFVCFMHYAVAFRLKPFRSGASEPFESVRLAGSASAAALPASLAAAASAAARNSSSFLRASSRFAWIDGLKVTGGSNSGTGSYPSGSKAGGGSGFLPDDRYLSRITSWIFFSTFLGVGAAEPPPFSGGSYTSPGFIS